MSEWKKYPREIYDASVSRNVFTDAEARKEYSHLRRLANKRLKAMERQGLDYTKAYQRAPYGGFPQLANMDPADLRAWLGDVARFLSMKTSSVRGIRDMELKTLETMNKLGYDFLNKKNIRQYMRFMQAAKEHYGDNKHFPSEEVTELYDKALERKEIADPEQVKRNFEYWMNANKWTDEEWEKAKAAKRSRTGAKRRIEKRRQDYQQNTRGRRSTSNTRKKGRR